MLKKINLMVIVLLLVLPTILAVPSTPLNQDFTNGFTILGSQQVVVEQNHDFQYNFFLYNESNGYVLNNDTINCTFYLSNNYGEVIVYQDVKYNTAGYWYSNIDGGNFSDAKGYFYGIKCTDGATGGATIGTYESTKTGIELTDAHTKILTILFFGIIAIALLFLILGFTFHTPSVRIFFISLSALSFLFSVGFLLNMARDLLAEFGDVGTSFSAFFVLLVTLIIVGGAGLMIFLVVFALNFFNKVRGRIPEKMDLNF